MSGMPSVSGMTISTAKPEFESHHIWLDEEAKIASFHAIEDAKMVELLTHDLFHSFIDGLISNFYRFQ